MWRQARHDVLVRHAVANCLHVLELGLLLCEHASVDDEGHQVKTILDLIRHINDAPKDTDHNVGDAEGPQDTVITSRVFAVEARLDEEAVPGDGTAGAAEGLGPRTIPVLRAAERSTREEAATANVWLPNEIQNLKPLLSRHAAHAAASETALSWGLDRSFEKSDLPLASEGLRDLLFDRHAEKGQA